MEQTYQAPRSAPLVPDVAAPATSDGPTLLAPTRPRLRGWLHAVMTPLVAAGGVALVLTNPTVGGRVGMTVFTITAILLFGVSALYHTITWGERTRRYLKRLDHADIYLVIAGTYTAFAVTLLEPTTAKQLLLIMWPAALVGVVFNVAWVSAPRWVTTPLYILLGWVAIFYIRPFYEAGGAAVVALIVAGGVLYTLGGITYGLKRPDPHPGWFGYHEVFHAFTVLAFGSHFVAAALATAAAVGAHGPGVGA